jgi:hypothetical protein
VKDIGRQNCGLSQKEKRLSHIRNRSNEEPPKDDRYATRSVNPDNPPPIEAEQPKLFDRKDSVAGRFPTTGFETGNSVPS